MMDPWFRASQYHLESGAWSIAVYYTGETMALGLWKASAQKHLITGIPRNDADAKRAAMDELKKLAATLNEAKP